MNSKGIIIGLAAGLAATALALASLSVTTTSGQSTDDEDSTPTAVATTAPTSTPTTTTTTPPQAPIEPVDPNAAGNQGAGVGPGELPDAGFGSSGGSDDTAMWVLLGLASAGFFMGAGMMAAGRKG